MRAVAISMLVLSSTAGCAGPNAASPSGAPPTGTASSAPTASAAVSPGAASPFSLVVTRAGVSVDGVSIAAATRPEEGIDAALKRSGKNDLYVVPLAEAFAKAQAEGRLARGTADRRAELTLVVNDDVPYRVVIEVLFTAGQNELGVFVLHRGTSNGPSITVVPPRIMGRDELVSEALRLSVLAVPDGLAIKTAGGNVAPGCASVGAGLAIPNRDGQRDFAALAACVHEVKEEARATKEDTFTFSASAATPFVDLFRTVEALRADFPVVQLAVAK